MRKLIGLAAIAMMAVNGTAMAQVERVVVGNLEMENIPEIPAEVSERLRTYQNVRGAGFQGFLPDGGILISTRFAETSQIHRVDAPLGTRSQLTYYDEPIGGASVRPGDSGEFLFSRDRGGDEYFQLFLFDTENGRTRQITEDTTRNGSASWSSDGEQIAWYRSTEGDPNWDILVADTDNPDNRRVLVEGEGAVFPGDWADDGSKIAMIRYYSITHSDLFIVDTASGDVRELNADLDIAYAAHEFEPGGDNLLVVTDANSDFRRVVRMDVETGEMTPVTPDHGWDVQGMDLSPDGRTLAYVLNAGGVSQLRMMDIRSGDQLDAPELPIGLIGGMRWDDAGERIGFTLNAATSPSDAWIYTLESQTLTRWTMSEVGGLNTETFVEPELISYESFDGLDVPAFVYRPDSDGPHPVIVSIHGGPESQYRPGFSSTFQYWLNELGAAVIAPNVRGSSGYGREYVMMDNVFNREDSVRDIGALLDWIETQPDLDSDRVVVFGGSYGGYMVLASLVHYSDRLAGGVNIVGISDFRTFLENTAGYRRDLRRAEYGDERDPDVAAFFEEISPARQAAEITAPLFIIQGLNDPRVPASEAEQILAAVREAGGDPWYLLANDEGHGFRKKVNRDFQREAETMFFREVLGLD
ncbi:alpha/beta fold hydrolase [Maricaulis sp.]|uniref:S9 family peptidase n=1 Tax=Maricaulis sp. TaxID=1486257 RepID=UPI00262C0D74|nr:alpha/beta fold hydrolase [Maricaulis sp.]